MTEKVWTVGWKDRGMGHGDYAVLDEDGAVVAEVNTGLYEDAILLAMAPQLRDGVSKAIAAGVLSNELRLLLEHLLSKTGGAVKWIT